MARIIEGLLRRLDLERGQADISGQTFALLLGLPPAVDVVPGMGVTALVLERDGIPRLIHLQPARRSLGAA